MRIKSKPQDFRVFELLKDGYVGDKGKFRVYRVTKKKLTTLEAAIELSIATGVKSSDIGLAGMKDRQGVTTQFMSVRGGKPVRFQSPSLKVEMAGFATHPLTSRDSIGNGFEIALRGVEPAERAEIERELVSVREHGVPNYFGEQRFGNLRHGQGWVAKELALGRHETALKNLLAAQSENDNPRMRQFKRGLNSAWGDWKRCRDVAGAFGAHHSIFEHLAKEPEDFAGAFRYVKTEVRLIHLYAFQSHLWNRAIARFIGETSSRKDRFLVPSLEGPLWFSRAPLAIPDAWGGKFRMPGEGLEDVEHDDQRQWLVAALAAEGLEPEDFRIHGVPGFALKGEDREIVVQARGLETFPDRRSDGVLHVRFDLPRGSYATLVLARLAPTREAETPEDAARRQARRAAEMDENARDGGRDVGRGPGRDDERAPARRERRPTWTGPSSSAPPTGSAPRRYKRDDAPSSERPSSYGSPPSRSGANRSGARGSSARGSAEARSAEARSAEGGSAEGGSAEGSSAEASSGSRGPAPRGPAPRRPAPRRPASRPDAASKGPPKGPPSGNDRPRKKAR